MSNSNFRFVSSHDLFKQTFQRVDYGFKTEYILIRGVRQQGIKVDIEKLNKSTQEEIERVEISRIKQKIREISLCNKFEYFFTQTIAYNRYDNEDIKLRLQKKFKAYKRINKDFKYLIIYEKHKDGAYHLHGLVSGLGNDLYINQNLYVSLGFFEDLGYNSLKKLGSSDLDYIRVSNYITKYITKDIVKFVSGFSYFHSKGLKFASRTHLDLKEYNNIRSNLKLKYSNDFVKIYDI